MVLIDKDELVKDLLTKMERFKGERQRGVAGVLGSIESGKYDVESGESDEQNKVPRT